MQAKRWLSLPIPSQTAGKNRDTWLVGLIITLGVLVLMTPLIVTPSVLYPWSTGKAAFARALIIIMGGAGTLLMLRNARYRLPFSPVVAAFGAYLLVALAATMFSVSATRSFWSEFGRMVGVVDYLLGFLYVVCLLAVLRSGAQWRALLVWAVAGVTGVALLALVQMTHVLDVEGTGPTCRLGSTTGNPTYLGALLAIALPVSAVLLADHLRRVPLPWRSAPWRKGDRQAWAYRGFLLASIALGIVTLFFTGSRGALVGVLAGGAVTLTAAWFIGSGPLLRRVATPVTAILALVAAGTVLSFAGMSIVPPGCNGSGAGDRLLATAQTTVATAQQAPVDFSINNDATAEEAEERSTLGAMSQAGLGMRWDLWRIGVDAWLARPWLGWGPENVAAAYLRSMDRDFAGKFSPLMDFSKPHNRIVEELVSTGALGTAAFMSLWLTTAITLLRRRRVENVLRGGEEDELVACGVFGALTGYFVASFFMFDTPATLWHWVLLVGWAAWYSTRGRVANPQRQPLDEPISPNPKEDVNNGSPRPLSSKSGLARPVRVIGVLAVTLVVAEGVLLSSVGPLMAAREFKNFAEGSNGAVAQLQSAQRGFDLSPMPTSVQTRQLLRALSKSWWALPPELQAQGFQMALAEVERSTKAEPMEMGPVVDLAAFYVATARTRGELVRAKPLLETLHREVPDSTFTVWVEAYYRVRSGEARQAVHVIDSYVADSPATAATFSGLRNAAMRQLQG